MDGLNTNQKFAFVKYVLNVAINQIGLASLRHLKSKRPHWLDALNLG